MDEGMPQPSVGSFLAVYDDAGFKADIYVIRVRDRVAFGEVHIYRPGAQVSLGDRVVGDAR